MRLNHIVTPEKGYKFIDDGFLFNIGISVQHVTTRYIIESGIQIFIGLFIGLAFK